jgi:hypothetical protein
VEKTGNRLIYLDKYKVVILNEPGSPSLGEVIVNKPSSGKGIRIWENWKATADSSVTLNVVEINRESVSNTKKSELR